MVIDPDLERFGGESKFAVVATCFVGDANDDCSCGLIGYPDDACDNPDVSLEAFGSHTFPYCARGLRAKKCHQVKSDGVKRGKSLRT